MAVGLECVAVVGSGGGFGVGLGLLCGLLSILSTASGDADIFGEEAPPTRSASLRNEPAGDFSDGSLAANCCLEWLVDGVDR